jgi:hypothetical protein
MGEMLAGFGVLLSLFAGLCSLILFLVICGIYSRLGENNRLLAQILAASRGADLRAAQLPDVARTNEERAAIAAARQKQWPVRLAIVLVAIGVVLWILYSRLM